MLYKREQKPTNKKLKNKNKLKKQTENLKIEKKKEK